MTAQAQVKLAIAGAGGRMGRELARLVHANPACVLSGGLEARGSAAVGSDMGALIGISPLGIAVGDDAAKIIAESDGILDFTIPAASVALAEIVAAHGKFHVLGTTGIDAAGNDAIARAAQKCVIVKSGNLSLGVNLLADLVRRAAESLGEDFDIEIVEMHHRAKVDAPSGTALLLGEAAAKGRAVKLAEKSIPSRHGHTGARNRGDIGFASLRGGTVIGEHSVILAGNGERIELRHVAESRELFARGAVTAALWAHGRAPGLYSMMDVLGLN